RHDLRGLGYPAHGRLARRRRSAAQHLLRRTDPGIAGLIEIGVARRRAARSNRFGWSLSRASAWRDMRLVFAAAPFMIDREINADGSQDSGTDFRPGTSRFRQPRRKGEPSEF